MTPIRCEHCGCELFALNDEGLILHAGGMVREVHGVCKCGHGYHWSMCDRQLERILERYNERKKELVTWMS